MSDDRGADVKPVTTRSVTTKKFWDSLEHLPIAVQKTAHDLYRNVFLKNPRAEQLKGKFPKGQPKGKPRIWQIYIDYRHRAFAVYTQGDGWEQFRWYYAGTKESVS